MIIYGKNPVGEAVKAGKTIDKLYILREESDARMSALVKAAKERGAVVVNADRRQLDKLTDGGNHQGIAAQVTGFEYCSVEDILAEAESRGEKPLIVLADGITDPHNLGAILRSAECLGAHGVIIPQRRSVSVNDTAVKSSSGAAAYVKVAKVVNLNDAIRQLKSLGVWVYACDFGGEPPFRADLADSTALIVGSEGEGVKRLTRELADGVITIPECGRINSLNASVAAGIMLYEAARQRAK